MRRAQLKFSDHWVAEEVDGLREDWMERADQILDDEAILTAVYEALAKRHPKSRSRGRTWCASGNGCGTASFVLYRSAARHFLCWLNRKRIPITDADTAIVRRFAEHRCCCPYYSAEQLRDPVYISRVGRFVRFLEDRGDILVVEDVEDIPRYLSLYAERLLLLGYSVSMRCNLYSAAEHFAAWLRVSRLQWRDVNDAVIERFVRHDCRCSL
jgi:hypothetical protein